MNIGLLFIRGTQTQLQMNDDVALPLLDANAKLPNFDSIDVTVKALNVQSE